MPTVEPYGYSTVTIPGKTITLYGQLHEDSQLPNPIEDLRKDVSDLRTEVAEIKGMLAAIIIALEARK